MYWAKKRETAALDEFRQCFVHDFNEDLKEMAWELPVKEDCLQRGQGYYPSPASARPLPKALFETTKEWLRTPNIIFKYTTLAVRAGAGGGHAACQGVME